MMVKKALLKTITYRILAGICTFGLSYLFFGTWSKSFWFTLTLMAIKTIVYYTHELVWGRIK